MFSSLRVLVIVNGGWVVWGGGGGGVGAISKKHVKHAEKKFNNFYNLISGKISASLHKPQHLQNVCQKN